MSATATASDTTQTADPVAAFESLLSAEDGTQEEPKEETTDETEVDASGQDAEETDETEEAEQQAEQEPAKYTVKIDGKETQVTLDELLSGHMRNADYTRKTQELSAQRKTATAELDAVKAERAHYQQNLDRLLQQIQQQAPQEPNWMQLANENPAEYVRQRAMFDLRQQNLQGLEAERRQVAEKQQADEAAAHSEHVEAERALLLDAIPEWKNEKAAAAERRSLVDFGLKSGFVADELSEVTDHRIVAVLRKAMLYDKVMAAKGTARPVQQQEPKPAQPGAPRTQTNDFARAQQRLAKSGDVADAARVFEHMM